VVDGQGCAARLRPTGTGREGQPIIDVWVNANAEQVELFLNDKSLGKRYARNGHQWQVPYEIAYCAGRCLTKKGRILKAQGGTAQQTRRGLWWYVQNNHAGGGKDTVLNISVLDKKRTGRTHSE
jgi:beta-galactosidase